MRPPGVQIVHDQLHHEVVRPVLLEVVLKDESSRPDLKDGHFSVEHLGETKCFIEPLGGLEVLGRQKGPGHLGAGKGGSVHSIWISAVFRRMGGGSAFVRRIIGSRRARHQIIDGFRIELEFVSLRGLTLGATIVIQRLDSQS